MKPGVRDLAPLERARQLHIGHYYDIVLSAIPILKRDRYFVWRPARGPLLSRAGA